MKPADHSLKIFVVDDHRDLGEGLADALRMHGHEVEVAYNGEQAIRTFREKDFDIAFMDVMMPGKNGVESFLEIRKIKPAAKVIMMTGYSVEQLLDQAIDRGAYGVLHKPVSIDDVLEALDRINSQGMVLVADDDPDFSAAIKEVIESNGYRVCIAHSGSEALKTVMGGGVDILVLDLQLPVISGLEVYMQLQRRGRALPTVVVTGHSEEQSEAIDTLHRVSSTGILTKPFDATQLLWELAKLAPGKAKPGPEELSTEQSESEHPDGTEAEAGPTATMAGQPDHLDQSDQSIEPIAGTEPKGAAAAQVESTQDFPPAAMRQDPPATAPDPASSSGRVTTADDPAGSRPATEPQPSTASPRSATVDDRLGKILVVDDDVDVLEGLAEVTASWGYSVETATTAEQATEIIQSFDAQVALLDIRLGRSNGLELITALKEHRPNIYCVMITGNADKESAITALRRGAHDYLIKPLDPDEIFAILDRCLDRYNLQVRLNAAFEELQHAKDTAEQTIKESCDFIARMSDELRTPADAIIESASAFLIKSGESQGVNERTEAARQIQQNATKILELSSNAFSLAKAQSGELHLEEGEVDVCNLVSAVTSAVQEAAQEYAVAGLPEISAQIPDNQIKVWADERYLKQVLYNLLSNAIKFTPEGGRIGISVNVRDDGSLDFAVQDSGVGLEPEDIPKALAQFGRVDNDASNATHGVGLGLPLVAALVERHGGTFKLETKRGKGTKTIVNLPKGRLIKARTAA